MSKMALITLVAIAGMFIILLVWVIAGGGMMGGMMGGWGGMMCPM